MFEPDKRAYRELFELHAERLANLRPGPEYLSETLDNLLELARRHPHDVFFTSAACGVYLDVEKHSDDLEGP